VLPCNALFTLCPLVSISVSVDGYSWGTGNGGNERPPRQTRRAPSPLWVGANAAPPRLCGARIRPQGGRREMSPLGLQDVQSIEKYLGGCLPERHSHCDRAVEWIYSAPTRSLSR